MMPHETPDGSAGRSGQPAGRKREASEASVRGDCLGTAKPSTFDPTGLRICQVNVEREYDAEA